jgi:hypothetical protein
MKVSLRNDIYEFEEKTHSHTLAPRDMAQYLRFHRRVTETQIADAEVAKSDKATIDPMAKQVCGFGNLAFTRVDIENWLHSKRTLSKAR